MRKDGMWRRPLAWLEPKAPGLHDFLTTDEKRPTILREVLGGVLVILLLVTLLWGTTGQPLNESPVVVVESESMMRCDNGLHARFEPSECEGPFGRLRTIDPGDLIFVADVEKRGDVETFTECEAAGHRSHFGACGDTIVYRRDGSSRATPVIHRAMFWLEVHGDDTYSVPGCPLQRATAAQVQTHPCVRAALAPSNSAGFLDALEKEHRFQQLGPAASGFITMGDNNPDVDQPTLTYPVQVDWILGKARGELPWLGLVKLWVSDIANDCSDNPAYTCNYARAPGDLKLLMFVTLALLIAGPVVVEKVVRKRNQMREERGP